MTPRDEPACSEATSLVGSQRAGCPVCERTQDLKQDAVLRNVLCFSAEYGEGLFPQILKCEPVTFCLLDVEFMP